MPKIPIRKLRRNELEEPASMSSFPIGFSAKKVSDESMNKESTSSMRYNADGTYRIEPTSPSSSMDTFQSVCSARQTSFRLKRPSPSLCLVDMAADSSRHSLPLSPSSTMLSPQDSNTASPWGQFVDMVDEEEDNNVDETKSERSPYCYLFKNTPSTHREEYRPYPKRFKRPRIVSSADTSHLQGFVLHTPSEIEETAAQLRSLSF